jgi:hypothetical protein
MPFKSKAQRRKFAELLVKGEISDEVYERWNRETGRAELPERATRATRAKQAKKVKRSGAKKTKRAASTRKRTKRGSTKRR